MNHRDEIGVYYFPNYHRDPQNEKWHGPGWTEWELMKKAGPRFPGHNQPKVPMWGYEDESDPAVMEKKIDAAADHGITSFIFDWYWFDGEPFLQRGLEDGYLGARNNKRLKFSLMWANHLTWADIHPAQRNMLFPPLADGRIDYERFVRATDYMITKYFWHPSYWRVDGGLYLSFYEVLTLVEGLGGVENTRRVLDEFRQKVRDAGCGELHLNAIVTSFTILPQEVAGGDMQELLRQLGFDSATSYVWVHHQEMKRFPFTSYPEYRKENVKDFERLAAQYGIPYYPNVTMGWDPSPRTIQSDTYENMGYPFTPILEGNTPGEFKQALEEAKRFFSKGILKQNILTINAWNEWTEGSYLEPDTENGMGYLEAIREVFGTRC